MKLVAAFLVLALVPQISGNAYAQGDMSREIAQCLLEKAPDQARAIAITKPGERFVIPKQPCGVLPPKSRVSEILSEKIKEAAWPKVIDCMRQDRNFEATTEALNSQYFSSGFQKKIAKAKDQWRTETSDSDGLRGSSIPEIRIMDMAIKLGAVKSLVTIARQCDAEFVDANFGMDLALLKPFLVKD